MFELHKSEIEAIKTKAKKEVFDIFEKYAKGIDKGHIDNKFWDWFKNTRKFHLSRKNN